MTDVSAMVYDRALQDIGNIVEFGHVDIRVPDQRQATLFYIVGLGLTRDPYLVVGVDNTWVNVGHCQFHLPTGTPQVSIGLEECLVFRETEAVLPAFDGRHVQVALADFSGPHTRLRERGLITEESNQWQYRSQSIIDLESRAIVAEIEHEVRSMRHPMYARPLVNRDPVQTNNSWG